MRLHELITKGVKKIRRKFWIKCSFITLKEDGHFYIANESEIYDFMDCSITADDWEEYVEEKEKKKIKLYRYTIKDEYQEGSIHQSDWMNGIVGITRKNARIILTEEKEVEVDK